MKNLTILLDAGHGGMFKGRYQTHNKKYYNFSEKGVTAYEGAINRALVAFLEMYLKDAGFDVAKISHEYRDTPLSERVALANAFHAVTPCMVCSIHNNAASPSLTGKGSTANGTEVFTSPGQTKSDLFASDGIAKIESLPIKRRIRKDLTDGDPDKEAEFYMLTQTDCPAVLWEMAFFDNWEEYNFITDPSHQRMLMKAIADGIVDTYNKNYV